MLDRRIAFLQWLTRVSGRSFRPGASVEVVRAGYRELNRRFGLRPVIGVETSVVAIPVSDGARIWARLHRPVHADATLPVLLYFHGGGWVIGDAETYDPLTRYFAHEGRIAVVAVDYRKGPEHRIPVPFEDGFDAYAWLLQHAAEYRLDSTRIAVGGDSAGGTIAAAIGTYAVDRGLAPPAFQFLIYPPVDGTLRFPSRNAYRRGDFILPEMRTWFAQYALSDIAGMRHPYLTLLDAPHPERTPPTYLLAAGYDSLVDEGRAYAERLRAAGVPVTYALYESLPHGLVNVARVSPTAQRALKDGIDAVSRALLTT